ncbi:MAG: hypothetical protein IIA98_08220, partial [Proteobacteria bacterium]|nr:hypothetical protein [Pseudomonadota bacterium]
MNEQFHNIALVGKHRESAEAEAMAMLGTHLLATGREVLLAAATAGKIDLPGAQACAPEKLAATADLLIAIGGGGNNA